MHVSIRLLGNRTCTICRMHACEPHACRMHVSKGPATKAYLCLVSISRVNCLEAYALFRSVGDMRWSRGLQNAWFGLFRCHVTKNALFRLFR